MEITRELVAELNDELKRKGCCFKYKYSDIFSVPYIQLEPISVNYIDSYRINPTNEFFMWLNNWFETKGVTLIYNNIRNVMWSATGSSDREKKLHLRMINDLTYVRREC